VIGSLRSLSVLLAAPLPDREFQMTPQDLLRLHPFFSALLPTDIDKLLMRTRHRRVLAGKVLFEKNAPGDGLYGVLSGRIAFTVDSVDGKKLTLNVLESGEFFGEIALLDGKGRSAAATARDASELLFIPRKEFLSFVRGRPDMMLHIMAVVCGRLRRSTEYIADAAFLDLSRRLAKQLVVLLNGHGASPEAGLHISHAELASMLGASRERVTRLLAAWGDKGILDQGRSHLVVRNPRALEQLVGDG
jgi:CRP-like cAMP-binding protein